MARALVKTIKDLDTEVSTNTSDVATNAADVATKSDINEATVIGDVVQSMLTETEFQTIRGLGWVLMDGQDVTGSAYAILKEGDEITPHSVPDARGRYLRAADWAGYSLGQFLNATKVLSWGEFGGGTNDMYMTDKRLIRPTDYDPDNAGSTVEEGTGGGTKRFQFSGGTANVPNRRSVVRVRPRSLCLNYFIKIN